jgi:hypothetical protein
MTTRNEFELLVLGAFNADSGGHVSMKERSHLMDAARSLEKAGKASTHFEDTMCLFVTVYDSKALVAKLLADLWATAHRGGLAK